MYHDRLVGSVSSLPEYLSVLSLRQPWASLVAMSGVDRVPSPWAVDDRGLYAIHAHGRDSYVTASAAWNSLVARVSTGTTPLAFPLPQDAVIAIGQIVGCEHGNTGWAVVLADVRRAPQPIPAHAGLGLWRWRVPAEMRAGDYWVDLGHDREV